MSRRKICAVLVDRANYGRMRPVLLKIHDDPDLELDVVAGGTMVLERFGSSVNILRRDGLPVSGEVYMELEGSTPATMAKSVGIGIMEFANEFGRLRPDLVLMIGDRYEALSAAIAAAYMNICLVHIQGGEVSGSIDESARHAITKFAHYHFPATQRAADYLVRMGELPETILGIGCPSSDIAFSMTRKLPPNALDSHGSGAEIDLDQPFILALFHPTTTEFGGEAAQMEALLQALNAVAMPTVLLWPNIDAGSDHISKAIRRFRDQNSTTWLRMMTNLEPEPYLEVLSRAQCAVGNSSSFVRDAGYFGTPVVLVGGRQAGRERGEHVCLVEPTYEAILGGIRRQLDHGDYPPTTLYGDGAVSDRIVEGLKRLKVYRQKSLGYIQEA